MRADPNNGLARLDLSFDYASIGYALSTMGDFDGSIAHYNRALSEREQVATADPDDVNARDAVLRAHLSIGQVLRGAGRLENAIPHYLKARDLAADRYAADPGNVAAGERLATVYSGLAGTHGALASTVSGPARAAVHWRETRGWAQKSLETWRGPGTALSAAAIKEIDGLTALVARSEKELIKLAAQR